MKKIAIVPARAGSKGLKNKNIIDLCGKPLMNYSIEAALDSGCFDHVFVSTDSEEYGRIAAAAGVTVVYRGEEVSCDTASTYMVIEDFFKKTQADCDYFVLLQPTSPLRNSRHILEAVELFENRFADFDFLVSMREAEFAKILVNPLGEDGSLKHFDLDYSNYRRQSYKDYVPNGAIYAGKPDRYLRQKHFFGARSIAYIMNAFDSLDIDNELDYQLAALCIEKMRESGV